MGLWQRISNCGVDGVKELWRTSHEVREVAERLAEDDVAVLRDTLLELLLEVAAAMLVLAEVRDLANEILKARAREAVD